MIEFLKGYMAGKYPFEPEGHNLREVYSTLEPILAVKMKERGLDILDSAMQKLTIGSSVLNEIEFRFDINHLAFARSFRHKNKGTIAISTGMIHLLAMQNYCHLEFLDMYVFLPKCSPEEKRVLFNPIFISAHDAFFFHRYPIQNGIPLYIKPDRGASSYLKALNVDLPSFLDSSIHFALDHQLELLVLHEMYHLLYGDWADSGDGLLQEELRADRFAVQMSRMLWREGGNHHTSFCETFMMAPVLYEGMFKYLDGNISRIRQRRTSSFEMNFPVPRNNHPPPRVRFENMCRAFPSLSELGRVFLQAFEEFQVALIHAMARNDMNMTKWLQITRLYSETAVHDMLIFENRIPKEVPLHLNLTDSADLLLPPKILNPLIFFEGEIRDNADEPVDPAQISKLCRDFGGRYFDVIQEVFGPISDDGIKAEISRSMRVLG